MSKNLISVDNLMSSYNESCSVFKALHEKIHDNVNHNVDCKTN